MGEEVGQLQRVNELASQHRRALLEQCVRDVIKPQRELLLGYQRKTLQSAQLSDGYAAQLLASIVTGNIGYKRRGKSGTYAGDLEGAVEVKSAYRIDQLNHKEDTHINFGMLTPAKLDAFRTKQAIIIVHQAYDPFGHPKTEFLLLKPQSLSFNEGVDDFQARSVVRGTARPQLQPRLYPDNVRNRLQERPGAFKALGARLIARVATVGNDVVVDKWAAEDGVRVGDWQGLPLDECLHELPGAQAARPPSVPNIEATPESFVEQAMAGWRRRILPYCEATNASQNISYGYLAQHLVSLVTGIPGSGAAARGDDLIDGSEVKLAMGYKNDEIGTEGVPRLNLQSNVYKILRWTNLYAVRIVVENDRFKVKVLRPDMQVFRRQVESYFGPSSIYGSSVNMQYAAPASWGSNTFTGLMGDGSVRALNFDVQFCAEEVTPGRVRRCD